MKVRRRRVQIHNVCLGCIVVDYFLSTHRPYFHFTVYNILKRQDNRDVQYFIQSPVNKRPSLHQLIAITNYRCQSVKE